MSKENWKSLKIHSSTRIVNFLTSLYILLSYPSKWAILVTEMHFPIKAIPELTHDLRDTFINAKKINVKFYKPVSERSA